MSSLKWLSGIVGGLEGRKNGGGEADSKRGEMVKGEEKKKAKKVLFSLANISPSLSSLFSLFSLFTHCKE